MVKTYFLGVIEPKCLDKTGHGIDDTPTETVIGHVCKS